MVHFENPIVGMDCQNCWAMMLHPREKKVFISDCETMQFTGFKDANGTEIYEGDIIRSFDSKREKIIHVIEYDEEAGKYNAHQRWITEFHKEVIGNKYQNPELVR